MKNLSTSPILRACAILVLVCAFGATLKLSLFGVTDSSDYREYIALAQYISGDASAQVSPHRFLKPLNPALVALLATVTDYQSAFLFQALFFYIALVLAIFYYSYEFFEDVFPATLIAAYVALSYPILKYGVDILTETGALSFYVWSLLLTLKYLKAPSWRLLLANAAVVTIGFMWKEYVIVAALIFGITILFHSSVPQRVKVQHILAYIGIFIAVHVPLQVYVYLHYGYSYLSWYSEGVHGAIKQNEFTLHNILKSTAALLGLLWLVVPFGLARYPQLTAWQKRFWQVGVLPPFIAYAWGYISSRLLFVMAPPFLLVAGMGMRDWKKSTQLTLVVLASILNIAWLFLSYRVKI